MCETPNGVTMTWGFGVEGVENLVFLMEDFNTDEYEELQGV